MRYAFIALALFLAACEGADPAGPQILNSGDNNSFAISTESNGPNEAATPAPVVITPVVLAPEGEEG